MGIRDEEKRYSASEDLMERWAIKDPTNYFKNTGMTFSTRQQVINYLATCVSRFNLYIHQKEVLNTYGGKHTAKELKDALDRILSCYPEQID